MKILRLSVRLSICSRHMCTCSFCSDACDYWYPEFGFFFSLSVFPSVRCRYTDFHSKREELRKARWCNHSRNFDRCVCVCASVQKRDRQGGFRNTNVASRMRRAILFSLSVEMKTAGDAEESRQRDEMKESTGKRKYGGERFVCISLGEMESYYRYNTSCQQLLSEFCKAVCVCVIEH